MTITVNDLDKQEAWSAETILTPGQHVCWIDEAEEGESSGGNPEIRLLFRATDGTGSCRDWLHVTPNTMGKVRQFLDAVGIPPEGGEWELPIDRLPGRTCKITVMEEPDRDDPSKMRTRVRAYQPADSSDVPADAPGPGSAGPAADNSDLPF